MYVKMFDCLIDIYVIGLNFDYQYLDNLNLLFDLSYLEVECEVNNGGGDQLLFIGYVNCVCF